MKLFFSITFLTFLTFCNAQATKVDIVDFYYWTAADGQKYEVMIVTEDFSTQETTPATIRVKYPRGNDYNIVEYYSSLSYDIDEDSNMLIYLMAESEASFIKGVGSYSPDNFVMSFDVDGNLISGLQADNTELDKADGETVYADVYLTEYGDADNMRSLIKGFYDSSDTLYRDLMNYTAQFD